MNLRQKKGASMTLEREEVGGWGSVGNPGNNESRSSEDKRDSPPASQTSVGIRHGDGQVGPKLLGVALLISGNVLWGSVDWTQISGAH